MSRKGIPNYKTQHLFQIASDLEVDPFEVLLRFAKRDWKGLGYPQATTKRITASGEAVEIDVIPPELQLSAAEKCCTYLYPKRKSIDLTTHGGGLLDEVMAMDADERKQLIAAYASKLNSTPKAGSEQT